MRVLAIDVGSSSVKAAVWEGRAEGGRARVEFRTEFSGVRAEAPAARILRAVERAGRESLRGMDSIDAVAFCAFSSAVVVTDDRGNIRAGAITHQDRRSVAEAGELVARLGKKWLLERTGNLPYPGGIGSSTLAWLRRHQPGVFRGKYRAGQLGSLVAWMLTGEWVTDPSQAVFLGLWDITRSAWNERICAAAGLGIEHLPEVKWADEVIGGVGEGLARRWGIRAGTPVVGGFVDTSAAVLETPMKAGQMVHSTGSTDVLAMCVDRAAAREGILSRPVGVGAVFKERWLAVRTIAAAGSALDWARRTLFSGMSDAAWRRLERTACEMAGDDGAVECVPHFAGTRAAIQQRQASFSGITLGSRPMDFLAAIVRGLVRERAEGYAALAEIQRPGKTVYAAGSAKELQAAMHTAWPRRHVFQRWEGDHLRGLATLRGGFWANNDQNDATV